MKRREALRELFTPVASDGVAAEPQKAEPVASGALRAMGLSLKQLSAEAEEARSLRARIEAGEHVLDLDPQDVEPSFISDRIPREHDPEFGAFAQSIAERGQQVPILVRPHPEKPDRYQVAYGHRRLKAAATLGRKVRAIVRSMTDTELVVAQGKENLERRDLSFIERALFAMHLEERKFDRATIMAAIGVDKGDLSRLIAVAKAIPSEIIMAIGPAPRAGRPRWRQFVDLAAEPGALRKAKLAVGSDEFRKGDTDARFNLILATLQDKRPAARSELITCRGSDGRSFARLERTPKTLRLTVEEAGFGMFLADRLPELVREFEAIVAKANQQEEAP